MFLSGIAGAILYSRVIDALIRKKIFPRDGGTLVPHVEGMSFKSEEMGIGLLMELGKGGQILSAMLLSGLLTADRKHRN